MTPERWREVKKVLGDALERTPEERSAYIAQVCAEPDLRREVESLIAAHDQANTIFLTQPNAEPKEPAVVVPDDCPHRRFVADSDTGEEVVLDRKRGLDLFFRHFQPSIARVGD